MKLSNIVPPPKLRPFLGLRKIPGATVLDVGCGNHSPRMTKRWLPNCSYWGLDRQSYNNSSEDERCIDRFVEADLNSSDLSELPEGAFDGIIVAHVIEHLLEGESLIGSLAPKLRPGGQIYIEFPSERSATLPSGVDTLNFYDDPTHVRLYSVEEVKNACSHAELVVEKAGARRDPAWAAIGFLTLPLQLVWLMRYRKPFGPLLWDLTGFASFILARKPAAAGPSVRKHRYADHHA